MLKLDIMTPEAVLLSVNAQCVTIPAKDGIMQIFADHMPLIVPLKDGEVVVEKLDGGRETFAIESGLADISNAFAKLYVRQAP